jgi:glycosyltransferase 2 family protein
LSARNLAIALAIIALLVLAFIVFNRYMNRKKNEKGNMLARNIRKIKQNFMEGIQSIIHLENKWAFVGHTIFIFIMWLFMLYVIFLAYPPTAHLSLQTGMITFLMGGLAMLAPVQGGIGPWHFMVYETLFIYGIDKYHGKIFALIAHASTNLIYLVFGLIALIIIPMVNRNKTVPTQR